METISPTGKPSSAVRMAGARSSFNFLRPNLSASLCQPSTAPGTVTEKIPVVGMERSPLPFNSSMFIPRGAQPLAFRPYNLPVFASYTMAKRSPPIPLDIGAMTPIMAFTAMAASTAFPPRSRISTPACAASGDSAATMP